MHRVVDLGEHGRGAWRATGAQADAEAVHHNHVDNCRAVGSNGVWQGGAVMIPSGAVCFSFFIRQTTDYAVLVLSGGTCALRNCAFSRCTAYFKAAAGLVTLTSCVFSTALPEGVSISYGADNEVVSEAPEAMWCHATEPDRTFECAINFATSCTPIPPTDVLLPSGIIQSKSVTDSAALASGDAFADSDCLAHSDIPAGSAGLTPSAPLPPPTPTSTVSAEESLGPQSGYESFPRPSAYGSLPRPSAYATGPGGQTGYDTGASATAGGNLGGKRH
jgi:hypothetical protein